MPALARYPRDESGSHQREFSVQPLEKPMPDDQPNPVPKGPEPAAQQPATAAPSVPPAAPPEPTWARRLRYIGPLGPLVTMAVLATSAFAAWNLYYESKSQNAA